jgi:SAM-dependent methyltransferase
VGGGNGAFSLSAAADYDCWFQELDPDRSERLRDRGVTVLETVDEAPAGTFDAITLWDVYEHVWPHAPFLRPIRRALAPEGLLLVEVPTPSRLVPVHRLLGRWRRTPAREASLAQICDFSHLQLMTPRELMYSLRLHGFEVVHHELLSELSYAGVVYARRILRPEVVAKCVGAAFDWRPLRRMVLGNNKVFVVAKKLA